MVLAPAAAAQLREPRPGRRPRHPASAPSGWLCLIAIALAVSLSALTIGTILSTALLVGPAATAMRLTRRPGRAPSAPPSSAWP